MFGLRRKDCGSGGSSSRMPTSRIKVAWAEDERDSHMDSIVAKDSRSKTKAGRVSTRGVLRLPGCDLYPRHVSDIDSVSTTNDNPRSKGMSALSLGMSQRPWLGIFPKSTKMAWAEEEQHVGDDDVVTTSNKPRPRAGRMLDRRRGNCARQEPK